jgi:hypothetical protein
VEKRERNKESREQDVSLKNSPVMPRRAATAILAFSIYGAAYEVLSNLAILPGWVWGVAGYYVALPAVWEAGKNFSRSWRKKDEG